MTTTGFLGGAFILPSSLTLYVRSTAAPEGDAPGHRQGPEAIHVIHRNDDRAPTLIDGTKGGFFDGFATE